MILFAFFTNAGIPALGLIPTIDVWDSALNHPINAQAMTEIAGGWYQYDFVAYNDTVDYVIRADGGAGLADFERYVFASNECDSSIAESEVNIIAEVDANEVKIDAMTVTLNFLRDIEGGRWRITGNQMLFYAADNVTLVATFNLFDSDGNPSMENVAERRRV